jgi:hypothetical protein
VHRTDWWAKHWQKVVAAAIWVLLIGGLITVMRANALTLPELFLAGIEWASAHPLAPLAYIVIYAVRPLTLFSSVLLTLAGGFLFGPLWGVLYTVIGATPRISPRPPRLRVRLPEHLARGAAEDAERGSVFPGVLDSEGESGTKSQISTLHHFSSRHPAQAVAGERTGRVWQDHSGAVVDAEPFPACGLAFA